MIDFLVNQCLTPYDMVQMVALRNGIIPLVRRSSCIDTATRTSNYI
jgi:hypothetical protein